MSAAKQLQKTLNTFSIRMEAPVSKPSKKDQKDFAEKMLKTYGIFITPYKA